MIEGLVAVTIIGLVSLWLGENAAVDEAKRPHKPRRSHVWDE